MARGAAGGAVPCLPRRASPEFDGAGQPLIRVAEVPTVRKSDAEWKHQLAVDQYTMTRRADTEMAFAGEYWDFHGDGLYRCVCCTTALSRFAKRSSSSGTGWPSFFARCSGACENIAEFHDSSVGNEPDRGTVPAYVHVIQPMYSTMGRHPAGYGTVSTRFVFTSVPRAVRHGFFIR